MTGSSESGPGSPVGGSIKTVTERKIRFYGNVDMTESVCGKGSPNVRLEPMSRSCWVVSSGG